ncbi:MAG: 50S ribosomal protein L15 [Candidatus Woykebacteria bacterium]
MNLHELTKIKTKKKLRVGRGESSGKGKTAGRGMKGQKKRGKVKIGFEGGQLPIYQRLPQKRGLGNINNSTKITLTTKQLNQLPAGSTVNEKTLIETGFLPKNKARAKVRVVLKGKLEKKLILEIPVSKKAKAMIEKVGGKIIYENPA